MATALMYAAIVVGCVVVAGTLLAIGDWYEKRVQQQQSPKTPEQRIAEIRADAVKSAKQLQDHFDLRVTEHTDANAKAKLAALVDYYNRFAALTSKADISIGEVEQFANECNEYLREYRLKGIMVGCEANELAELLRKRDAA